MSTLGHPTGIMMGYPTGKIRRDPTGIKVGPTGKIGWDPTGSHFVSHWDSSGIPLGFPVKFSLGLCHQIWSVTDCVRIFLEQFELKHKVLETSKPVLECIILELVKSTFTQFKSFEII